MLAIRLQRTGRKGHAQFRVIVQDARRTPTSGRVVASLGNYNPHTKTTTLDKEKVTFYLKNGAQPSPRIVRLLKSEDIKLPEWVKIPADKQRSIRHADKLRKNRPEGAEAPEPEQAAAEEEKAPEAKSAAESNDSKEAQTEEPSAKDAA